MLKTADIINKFETDVAFIRRTALEYIKAGDFELVERRIGIEQDTLERLFYDNAKISDLFDAELDKQTRKKLNRESKHKIFKLIGGLQDIMDESGAESEGSGAMEKLRAATILSGLLTKFISTGDDKTEDKDEIDRIYEELAGERKAKTDP